MPTPRPALLLTALGLVSLSPLPAQLPPRGGDAKKEEKSPGPPGGRDPERIRERNHRKAQEAWARDQKKRSAKDYAAMEAEYQNINQNYKTPQVKQLLGDFIKKWKDGNRVGCATLYLAQKSSGDEREKLLETCVRKFSDAYYLDGCNVGGLSRLFLASHLNQYGKKAQAKKLIGEIEKDYAEAADHQGKLIIDQLGELQK